MLWRGFQKPKRLAVEAETLTEKYGKFSAQPFERGFGTTIGNALRRTLLSSIEGAAVTAVKMEGVLHEFQSITGVVEDATDIILNLKQIPFKLSGEGPKALYLRADQPGVVTSGHRVRRESNALRHFEEKQHTMKQLLNSLLSDESGQDLIEYALIAALIALVAITGLNGLAGSINAEFTKIGGDL